MAEYSGTDSPFSRRRLRRRTAAAGSRARRRAARGQDTAIAEARLADLAIDFCEDVPALPRAEVERM